MVSEMTGCKTLRPKQIQHTWAKGGGTRDTVNDLMPGYVFLYCAEKADVTKPGLFRQPAGDEYGR